MFAAMYNIKLIAENRGDRAKEKANTLTFSFECEVELWTGELSKVIGWYRKYWLQMRVTHLLTSNFSLKLMIMPLPHLCGWKITLRYGCCLKNVSILDDDTWAYVPEEKHLCSIRDFPGGSDGKASAYNALPGFDPWVRKIPWRRKWQPAPVLLPEKSHGRRILVGYSSWGRKESEQLSVQSSPTLWPDGL